MDKADVYRQIVLSILRQLLSGASALLIAKGFITADQSTFLITEAAGVIFAIVVLVWVWVRNHTAAKLVNAALVSSPDISLDELNAKAARQTL